VASSPQLTVLGLDAATLDVVDPLCDAGELPNLARLFAAGCRGTLRSTTHPLTPQAWSTLVTGVNAGRHGIWDFSERDESGHRLRVVNGSYRRAPAVWDHLSAAGRRVGVVNVPFTWPAPEVNGFCVAGLDAAAREQGMTYPRELVAELRRRVGALELDHAFPLDAAGVVDLDHVRRACEQKVEVVRWLAERYEPELLFVVFMSADHIHHLCWPEWEQRGAQSRVAEVYRILDEAVGELAGPEHGGDVLVVSDHGGGSLHGVVNLNRWLADEGFLAYAGGEQGGGLGAGRAGRRLFNRAFELRRHVPERWRTAVKQRIPGLRERAYELRQYEIVDWTRTRAFAYGTFGNVVVNVRGREDGGIVEPGAEYERVRDEIAARALELRSAEGEPMVAAVHRREELFDGPYLDRVPDLIVEFADYAWLGKGNLTSRTETIWDSIPIAAGSKEAYVGSHRHDGLIALSGPSASRGATIVASIEDVAPTLLYLMGEPIPMDLEGRMLVEAIEPSLLDTRPPEFGEAAELAVAAMQRYDEDEADEVKSRLRDLGYLE
jgi:predicted AlkP superfamily phosphohydrolase/phosphomutase